MSDQVPNINIEMELSSFSGDKQYKKFINNVKRMVRSSIEYRDWVDYIKFSLGYDYCSFTKEKAVEVTIDLHHHPVSLENIVRIVTDSKISKFNPITTFDIAKEVMKLHYDNNVGYVLLVTTLHEKFHNGFLKIPIEFVHGNWRYITENYFIDEDINEIISKYASITLKDVLQEYGESGYTWTKDNYILQETI